MTNEALRLAEACKHGWLENVDPDKCDLGDLLALLRQQAEQLDQLRAEVERLRADAERYRWLADCENFYEAICLIANPSLTAHDLGAAIDHARTTHKDEG